MYMTAVPPISHAQATGVENMSLSTYPDVPVTTLNTAPAFILILAKRIGSR